MKRRHLLLSGAWLVHAAAWLLPVVKGDVRFLHGLPGWVAWRISFCMVWPYEGFTVDPWYAAVLSTASALTTILFVLGSPWVIWRGSQSVRRVSAWIAVSAFLINSHWYGLFGEDRAQLRIGYFLWWLSFAILAVGLFDSARLSQDDESRRPQASSATST